LKKKLIRKIRNSFPLKFDKKDLKNEKNENNGKKELSRMIIDSFPLKFDKKNLKN